MKRQIKKALKSVKTKTVVIGYDDSVELRTATNNQRIRFDKSMKVDETFEVPVPKEINYLAGEASVISRVNRLEKFIKANRISFEPMQDNSFYVSSLRGKDNGELHSLDFYLSAESDGYKIWNSEYDVIFCSKIFAEFSEQVQLLKLNKWIQSA